MAKFRLKKKARISLILFVKNSNKEKYGIACIKSKKNHVFK